VTHLYLDFHVIHCTHPGRIANPSYTPIDLEHEWMVEFIKTYHWLTDVNFLEFWTFNVEFEFLSLFLHGFKTGESRHVLNVAKLALKGMPWVAIYCKEHDLSVKVRKKHADEMKRVVECLQGEHGTQ